ncbi:FAD binding domain-containing protein [Ilyonectria sp. MPI-CAGE-AT-0026]|nr:FAD binding domain-containing protein [Ilyonectria sp. MPI-CAGE-AT-0026]
MTQSPPTVPLNWESASTPAEYMTDCIIIGTGPAGGSLASFLGGYGVKGIAIGKMSTTAHTPRAHITNMATMECMRDIGLEAVCRKAGLDQSYMTYMHWSKTMAGEEYARVPAWGNGPSVVKYKAASPCAPMDLAQTLLEPILMKEALRSGFTFRFNTEFIAFSEDEARGVVRVLVRDLVYGQHKVLECKYFFGCDGARSRVLTQLGVPISGGEGAGRDAWNLLVRVDLSHLMQHRRGNLSWNFQEDHLHPGKILVVHPRMVEPWNLWVIGYSWAPGAAPAPEEEIEPTNEDWIRRLRTMIGDESVNPEIVDASKWQLNNACAKQYSRGRVFCLGDAVHRHTPGGGLGSNTCIQDSYNLAWKVAHVLKGKAGPQLLETYSAERQPVGAHVATSAMKVVFAHVAVWGVLGVLEGTPEKMRRQQEILRESSEEGEKLRESLRQALQQTQYELHGVGIEMNQRYASKAILVQGEEEPEPMPEPRLEYYQTTFPGARLPHAWLNTKIPSEPISTIDIAGKRRFTLFTGIGGEKWKEAAARVGAILDVDIAAFSIGYRQDYEDPGYDWERLRGVDESGAVLVRPDRFVAWRSKKVDADCEGRLLAALKEILAIST